MNLLARRGVIVLGVAASLLLGAVSIRAAATWTAASAPLAVSPTSAGSLADQLDQEQARSKALQAQLDELASRTSDLSTALAAAQERISTDASTAKQLRTRLASAQQKLAVLTTSIQRSQAAAAAAAATPATTAPVAIPAGGGSHGGDDD